MKEGPDIARLASIIGDPARANMLSALMGGLALTAGELAREAGVTPQTGSAHLAKLLDAGLLLAENQGRRRYYRLAGPETAEALEAFMELAARAGRLRARPGPKDPALRRARVCYDHLAGELGVALYDALVDQKLIEASRAGLSLTLRGRAKFLAEGIDLGSLERKPRALCKACLDWSERRHHLSGSLGAAMLNRFFALGWAKRDSASRAVLFSNNGLREFRSFTHASGISGHGLKLR